jgi:hypothetical protein
LCTGARSSGSGLVYGGKRAPDDQLGERGGYLAVGLEVGLDVLLHGERDVRVAYPLAQRLPVDLGIAARGDVAVAHVVQVDLRQPGRRGELLEPPRDRIRVRRPAVLPAEQHAVIVVVRAELALLLIDCPDVRLEDGQRQAVPPRGAGPGVSAGSALGIRPARRTPGRTPKRPRSNHTRHTTQVTARSRLPGWRVGADAAIAYSDATMSRRRMADHYDWNRVVMVRCHRCRRVIGRLAGGWFQPKRPLATVKSPTPPVFTFPGSPKPLLHGRPMKGVTVIPLDGWALAGLHCGCWKRDGSPMTWTLNLHRMGHASGIDGRTHDLIAGMTDYGLIGIHDELEIAVTLDVAPATLTEAQIEALGPSEARLADFERRIRNRGRRKTWRRVTRGEADASMLESTSHTHTDDPVDRA